MNETLVKISATQPDWTRETLQKWWDPGRQLLRSIRAYQKWKAKRTPLAWIMARIQVLHYYVWSVVSGADIPLNCQLAGGLLLPHPNGVVIHPEARIGPNCLIFQQVTLVAGVTVGGHVDIGAGAKIIRPVVIGDHARIGANAVVLHDVPPHATVVGVPARRVDRVLKPSSNLLAHPKHKLDPR